MPTIVNLPLPPMFPVKLSVLFNGLIHAVAPATIVPLLINVSAPAVVCNVPPLNVIVPPPVVVPRLLAALICKMPSVNVVPPL